MLNELRKPLQATAVTFIVTVSLLNVLPAGGAETKSRLQSEPEGWVDILPPADLKG